MIDVCEFELLSTIREYNSDIGSSFRSVISIVDEMPFGMFVFVRNVLENIRISTTVHIFVAVCRETHNSIRAWVNPH